MASSTHGTLVVLKRNGLDGSRFPVKTTTCMIGRNADSDVRIKLPVVSDQHCRIDVINDGQIVLVNLSKGNCTLLNDVPVTTSAIIAHRDVFTVGDRSFRWEFMEHSPYYSDARSKVIIDSKIPSLDNGAPSLIINKITHDKDSLKPLNKVVSQKQMRSCKGDKKGTTPLQTPAAASKSYVKDNLSARKVSFGPNLSPEQFDHSLPSTTPIRKGARPSLRRSSLPDYYGNPVITSTASSSMNKDSASRDHAGTKRKKKSSNSASLSVLTKKAHKSSAKKLKVTSRSLSPKNKIERPKVSLKSKSAESKKDKGKSIGLHSDVDNAVKIVAPFLLDSKKSEALRTIHAGKLKIKSSSLTGRSGSSSKKILKVQTPFKTKDKKIQKEKQQNGCLLTSSQDELTEGSPLHPNELFVSPLNSSENSIKTPSSAVKRYLMDMKPMAKRSPRSNDSLNMSGIGKLLETPHSMNKRSSTKKSKARIGKSPVAGDTHIKHLFRRSPELTDSNVRGVKRLMGKSPKADYSDVGGVKSLFGRPPKSEYSDVFGLKRLMRSPAKSPKSDYTNVHGLKKLMKTPRKSPKSDYTDVHGLKKLMRTPRKSPKADYSDVEGLDKLFKERRMSDVTPPIRNLRVAGTSVISPSSKANYDDIDGLQEQTPVKCTKRSSSTSLELDGSKNRRTSKATPVTRNLRLSTTPATSAVTPARGRRPLKKSPIKSPSQSPKVRTLRSSVRKLGSPLQRSVAKVTPTKATPRGRKMKTGTAIRMILKSSPDIVEEGQSPKKNRVTQKSKKEIAEPAEESNKVAKKVSRQKADRTEEDLLVATPLKKTRSMAKKANNVESSDVKSPKRMVTRSTRQTAAKSPAPLPSPPASVPRRGRPRKAV